MDNLSGKRFGRWTVLRYAHRNLDNRKHLWLCECDCGTTKNVYGISLTRGTSESCGCLRSEITSVRSIDLANKRRESIIGRTFNRLTVLELSHVDQYGQSHYNCQCECGNTTTVAGKSLRGSTKSCGCLAIETWSTHGLSKHPLYTVWINIVRRCENEDYEAYQNYGGRGIKVCSEWRNSFETFYNWAIINGYRNGLSIDRIDNNSGYFPENCRFATYTVQNRNKRSTKLDLSSVSDIRESDKSSKYLSEKYNISVGHVNDIRSGRVWRDV